MKKIYIHEDTECAYRLSEEGKIEHAPLSQGNSTLSDEDFGLVEYDMVGDEFVMHEGMGITISDLEPIIRAQLV